MSPVIELVSTGAELLNGRTLNRHAQTLGDHLGRLGLRLARDTTVPDDLAQISEALSSALRRADVVVVSGGLGPTTDDITRDAVAAVLHRKIVLDLPSAEAMKARYRRLGREATPLSERQALVLDGAVVLPNSAGMAPGERVEADGKTIFILPGPPREFLAVLTEHVVPWLRQHVAPAIPPRERIFLVCGLGESDIAVRLEQAGFPPPGLQVAYCASCGRVEVRLLEEGAADGALERAAEVVRKELGSAIYSEDRSDMAEVVGRLLASRGKTLATAESCTGGWIGQRLTAVAGSSAYYVGGVIAYSNAVKTDHVGVPVEVLDSVGAVSEETALLMAHEVRERFHADYGVSVTGIAGPSGGTPEKPVGLVCMAVADAAGSISQSRRFTGERGWIREWAVQFALDLLRRRLLDHA